MPSVGIHLMVLDEVVAALRSTGDPRDKEIADLLTQHSAFASLGAVGPDLGFFLGTPPSIVAALSRIFAWINKLGAVYTEAAGIAGTLGFPNLADRLKQVGATIDLLIVEAEGLFTTALVETVTYFSGPLMNPLPIQEDKPETEWGWGDLMHWRISGALPQAVMTEALNTKNESWRAYSIAYLTHIAADVAGHPYTNQVVGGASRAFGMRHHIAENYMDVDAYWRRGIDVSGAKFHKRMDTLRNTQEIQDFAAMLSNRFTGIWALKKVAAYPRPPTADDIEDAFEAMLDIFQLVTDTLYVPPPSAPGISIPPLPGAAGSLAQQAASLFPSNPTSWSLGDILAAILKAALVGLAAAADIVRLAVDTAIGVATYPIAAAIFSAQVALYGVYRQIRFLLTILGVTFPCPDELQSSLGQQFVPCRPPDDTFPHQVPVIYKENPIIQVGTRIVTLSLSNFHYLSYPTTPTEMPKALSSPYVNEAPDYFINVAPQDPEYVAAWKHAGSPAQLDRVNFRLVRSRMANNPTDPPSRSVAGLGNARDLALQMIRKQFTFLDFNLDADRGYAYREWACSGGIKSGNVINPTFL